jgi:hypothetical protein
MVSNAIENLAQFRDSTRVASIRGSAPPSRLTGFDTSSEIAWCVLIREVAAVANSGGGLVSVQIGRSAGADNGGASIPAEAIIRRLDEYTDSQFDGVSVRVPASPDGYVEVLVEAADVPIGFRQTAPVDAHGDGDQVPIFTAGQFYFRHGGETVVGTTADIRAFFARTLSTLRQQWLTEIGNVLSRSVASIEAENGSEEFVPERAADSLQPVRIVNDPAAPALQPQYVDRLYPWRQKDLVNELNYRLGRREISTYDAQAVRRQHRLDERPDFVFHLPGAGRRYSPAAADWIMNQYREDSEFFKKAHVADQAMLRQRRQKPK